MHYIQNISTLEEVKQKNINFIKHLRNIIFQSKGTSIPFDIHPTHSDTSVEAASRYENGSPGTTGTETSREASPRAIPSLKVTFACARSSRGRSQWAHDFRSTSYQRRCDVMTSHRRRSDVILTSCARWACVERTPILITMLVTASFLVKTH